VAKKHDKKGASKVTPINDAPRKVTKADYPAIAHACELLLKFVAKTAKALRQLSLPTAKIKSLQTQAEEAQRLLRKAQGDADHAPTATFTLPAHVSAAVRVGVYLHLDLLEKVKHQQEKQMVARPEDTAALIRSLEKLADRLSDQLMLFEDTGVNQVTLQVSRATAEELAAVGGPADDDDQTDLGVGAGDGEEPGT
jgi:hypothetical protein